MLVKCLVCTKELPITEFFKDASNKLGVKPRCKDCTRVFKRKWRKDKQVEINSYTWLHKRRVGTNLTDDEIYLAYLLELTEREERHAQAALKKQERIAARIAKRYPKERRCFKCKIVKPIDKMKVDKTQYCGRGWLCSNCHWRAKHARKVASGERFSFKQKLEVRKIFGDKCFKCGSKERVGTDHHRPLAKGHPMTMRNAVALCTVCNSKKNNKDPELFYTPEELSVLKDRYGVY